MGPSKPSSLSSTKAWLKPTASFSGLGGKLGMDPQIIQPVSCGSGREPYFGGSGIRLNLLVTCERLLCVDRVRYVWCRTIRKLIIGCMWLVDRGFPYRVYINSNHHDSRDMSTTCLLQSSRSNSVS
jgi:hypothetical protein